MIKIFSNVVTFCVLIYSTTSLGGKNTDVYDSPAVNDLFSKQMLKMNCVKNLKKNIDPKLIDKNWSPLLIAKAGEHIKSGIIFRNSKSNTSYTIYGNKKTVVYEVVDKNTHKMTSTTFTAGICEPKVVSTNLEAESKDSKLIKNENVNLFTDLDLYSSMKKNEWGVIYVWTPYMPLSVQGIAEIKKAMKNSGGELTILLDPKATLSEAEKWVEKGLVQKNELKRAESNEIFDRGLGVHYPAVYIYKNEFLANSDYVGFKKAQIYSKWFLQSKNSIDKDLK